MRVRGPCPPLAETALFPDEQSESLLLYPQTLVFSTAGDRLIRHAQNYIWRIEMQKCPGLDLRNVRPEDIEVECPFCGEIVEIWPPSRGIKCPNCKKWVDKRGGIPSCADWCSGGEEMVRECLGEERYREWKESKQRKEGGDV